MSALVAGNRKETGGIGGRKSALNGERMSIAYFMTKTQL